MQTPSIVEEDLMNAVKSAIDFGVSAAEFKKLTALYWDEALREKREHDAQTFAAN